MNLWGYSGPSEREGARGAIALTDFGRNRSQKNSSIVSSMSPKLDDRFFVDLPTCFVEVVKSNCFSFVLEN